VVGGRAARHLTSDNLPLSCMGQNFIRKYITHHHAGGKTICFAKDFYSIHAVDEQNGFFFENLYLRVVRRGVSDEDNPRWLEQLFINPEDEFDINLFYNDSNKAILTTNYYRPVFRLLWSLLFLSTCDIAPILERVKVDIKANQGGVGPEGWLSFRRDIMRLMLNPFPNSTKRKIYDAFEISDLAKIFNPCSEVSVIDDYYGQGARDENNIPNGSAVSKIALKMFLGKKTVDKKIGAGYLVEYLFLRFQFRSQKINPDEFKSIFEELLKFNVKTSDINKRQSATRGCFYAEPACQIFEQYYAVVNKRIEEIKSGKYARKDKMIYDCHMNLYYIVLVIFESVREGEEETKFFDNMKKTSFDLLDLLRCTLASLENKGPQSFLGNFFNRTIIVILDNIMSIGIDCGQFYTWVKRTSPTKSSSNEVNICRIIGLVVDHARQTNRASLDQLLAAMCHSPDVNHLKMLVAYLSNTSSFIKPNVRNYHVSSFQMVIPFLFNKGLLLDLIRKCQEGSFRVDISKWLSTLDQNLDGFKSTLVALHEVFGKLEENEIIQNGKFIGFARSIKDLLRTHDFRAWFFLNSLSSVVKDKCLRLLKGLVTVKLWEKFKASEINSNSWIAIATDAQASAAVIPVDQSPQASAAATSEDYASLLAPGLFPAGGQAGYATNGEGFDPSNLDAYLGYP
jgi:hypothetical protein